MIRRLVPALFGAALMAHAAEPNWGAIEPYAVEFLQKYVRIASVNPPADTRAAAALFKAELEKHGFTPKLYQSGPNGQTNLVVRLAGRDRAKKPLLLMNHFDVVPVDAKAWSVDPFAAVIKDGYIWGRGTLDMKGIGVQQLMALAALKDSGIVPARDIVMLCTSDEETNGTYGIRWMLQNHLEDIDSEYVLDEGGMGTRDVLARNKLVFGVSVGEKQVLWLRLRARGPAGHGSQPIPNNANLVLLEAIRKALDIPPGGRENAVLEEMRSAVGEFAENKFTSAIQRNTMSLTSLTSGVGSPVKVNVIPSTAEATLDCRLLPGVNPAEFESEVRARINDPRVTVERLSDPVDAGASRSDTPLFAAIRKAILAQHPDAVVTPMFVPFGTDSVNLRKRGVIAYGLTPMILDAATAATMHSDEERIPLADFKLGIRIFYDVLKSDF
jgi:acetylornithine deacetylase/succinyl-diaminopimelate desuccinylase-like protein